MFLITSGNQGFYMIFKNRWAVSVQFNSTTTHAEYMAFDPLGEFREFENWKGEGTTDEVIDFINVVKSLREDM